MKQPTTSRLSDGAAVLVAAAARAGVRVSPLMMVHQTATVRERRREVDVAAPRRVVAER